MFLTCAFSFGQRDNLHRNESKPKMCRTEQLDMTGNQRLTSKGKPGMSRMSKACITGTSIPVLNRRRGRGSHSVTQHEGFWGWEECTTADDLVVSRSQEHAEGRWFLLTALPPASCAQTRCRPPW